MGCEEKDAKELKDATLIRRFFAPKKRWKESRWWQAKSNAALAPCYNQCLIHDYRLGYTVETVFFDFGCSLATKWESEWAKSNISSILKICMTNSLWLVSQLKHVLWDLFLGLTKRDLSLWPQIWVFCKGPVVGSTTARCFLCMPHLPASPRWVWGKAFANAWKMRAVLQPAWMLPQWLQLQGRDRSQNPPSTCPCIQNAMFDAYITNIYL